MCERLSKLGWLVGCGTISGRISELYRTGSAIVQLGLRRPERFLISTVRHCRSVAQAGRASVSKTEGRGFESCRSCHKILSRSAPALGLCSLSIQAFAAPERGHLHEVLRASIPVEQPRLDHFQMVYTDDKLLHRIDWFALPWVDSDPAVGL